jgi:hypothetical protein
MGPGPQVGLGPTGPMLYRIMELIIGSGSLRTNIKEERKEVNFLRKKTHQTILKVKDDFREGIKYFTKK